MAPIKRKTGPTNDSFVRSTAIAQNDSRPVKRARQSEEERSKSEKTRKVTSGVPEVTIAKPREEGVAFPRGGASVLTPLEHKQIQIDATRDVLFEQDAAKSKGSKDSDITTNTHKVDVSKKRKLRQSDKKHAQRTEDAEDSIKIEGLNYKRLVPGSLVLGQVSQINAHDIALSLPNNLTGYLPITSVSELITERVESMYEEDEVNEKDTKGVDKDIDLKRMVTVGQYLRAYVVSTSDQSDNKLAEKSKRHIELSTIPQQANIGLSANELIPQSMIMASVLSVEDHGLIMDIGFNAAGIRGFMSSKEIGHGIELNAVQEGSVFLCMITGLSSNGKTVKLCADVQKIAPLKKQNYLAEAPTVDAFLPGTAVEVLVTDITSRGLAGKVMGMLDVTADLMHSGAGAAGKDLEKKYKVGSKIKGRIICTFPKSDPRKIGISLLEHVMSLTSHQILHSSHKQDQTQLLPISAIIETIRVKKVEPGIGLFVDMGVRGSLGFVHISRVADGKIETLSETTGPYKIDSLHRGRIIGYNSMDGVYLVSLEKRVLDQAYLRIEDLKIGEVVKGKIEKIVINAGGVGGVLVNLSEGITGLVPEMHMADVTLLHPEKKFREGMSVTARVLSTDCSKRQLRLTLKKTLVNSEAAPWASYEEIVPGMQSPGTIVNLLSSGAVVQFYGNVRGFLPVSEMSEAYIVDPTQHFRVGQVVNVHVLDVDAEAGRMKVSCKDPASFGFTQQIAFEKLKIGDRVSATVTAKSNSDISVELTGSGLRATVPAGHLTDGSDVKDASAFKRVRVGQTLQDLVVLEMHEQKHSIVLTNKPSLLKASQSRTLLRSFEDVREQKIVTGFVKNITPSAVFVQFAGGLTGFLPKAELSDDALRLPDFGLRRQQSLTAKIVSVNADKQRFLLSIKQIEVSDQPAITQSLSARLEPVVALINPVDNKIKSTDDLVIGKLTSAKIASIKETQINVTLAENIQGRIDVSQVFDKWEEIKDRKHPLKSFAQKQILNVRILGIHDARNHRFLPISHRVGKTSVYELSAKPSDQTETPRSSLTLDKVKNNSSWIGYVNNIGEDCIWVNLSPNVRGRIGSLDVSDDASVLKNLDGNFPIGSAIKVHVIAVDIANNRLDLSAKSATAQEFITFENLTKGMVVPGKVTRTNERQIMVQLSRTISAPVNLIDLADDYSTADPTAYYKNQIVTVCVTEVDSSNKRIRLSMRPSRVLNSSAEVKDPEITTIAQLKVNDIVRGFVKHVADNGIFVSLGGNITAYVRISDLSDSYIKDWKSHYQIDQLVKGKVIVADDKLNHIQLSLKSSVIDKNYVSPITFNDLKVGQVVTGKVRKVEEFGAFIVVDGSTNVSGLCHRSEMAEKRVDDAKKLYEEGDAVKALVLKLDSDNKRVSFGLKASYFVNMSGDVDGNEAESDNEKDDLESDDEIGNSNDEEEGGAILDTMDVDSDDDTASGEAEENEEADDQEAMSAVQQESTTPGLSVGKFDWNAEELDQDDVQSKNNSDLETLAQKKKKKSKKPSIKIDRTSDLDAGGPTSSSDFERLLLGQPDSSELWIQYMAFRMKLSELEQAREIGERAIRTIDIREETEKLNVWIALLNLENIYGTDETVQEIFRRACQYNDAQEVHERLTSIYIQSGKLSKADDLFQILVKKFSQSPSVWYNYAHFLHTTMAAPDRARGLLQRAMQSLPSHTHLDITIKFAALEFHSPEGSPERGRTMFEGLLSTFPKRLDLWNQLLDLEIQQGDKEIIRGIFDRVTRLKGLKAKGAKAWFRRWSEWETKNGDGKSREKVESKAKEWVRMAEEKAHAVTAEA